jgi:hypothetical protein
MSLELVTLTPLERADAIAKTYTGFPDLDAKLRSLYAIQVEMENKQDYNESGVFSYSHVIERQNLILIQGAIRHKWASGVSAGEKKA